MSDAMHIRSHTGSYEARFDDDAIASLNAAVPENAHFIIDERVATLYADALANVLDSPSVLRLEATESNKSLDRMPDYVAHLVERAVRRDHVLVAIGGGIIQDITCFLSATLLRGVDWRFYPTTLLAQADSCIGSKSSINCGQAKNILGTFTPPRIVEISTRFLNTLADQDLRSGIGEILKVHAIDGPKSFDEIAANYEHLIADRTVLMHYIYRALEIKKAYIEIDEFDRGPRNIFNYGHSFGHAIEAATDFAIPHGIAVSIGMDMANFVASRLKVCGDQHYRRMHPTLWANYRDFETFPIPLAPFLGAIAKDKKNIGANKVTLILPNEAGEVAKGVYANDEPFAQACEAFLAEGRAA